MLRGFSILVMILIHTNAYFLSNKTAYFFWDLSEFAVPAFIFCSAYIFFKRNLNFENFGTFFSYVKKRFLRLLLPYYFFAFFFILYIYLKEPKKIDVQYLLGSFFSVGGIDISWLVLLFLMFSIIMPAVLIFSRLKKSLFYIFLFLSVASSFLLIFFRPLINYREIMWFPWSLIIFFVYYFVKYESSKKFLYSAFFFSTLTFILIRFIEIKINHPLSQYENKYPPNLYHLAFGISAISLFYIIAKTGIFYFKPIKNFLHFFSKHSYSVFFLHYFLIFIFMLSFTFKFNWLTFFFTIFITTAIIQKTISWINQFMFLERSSTME